MMNTFEETITPYITRQVQLTRLLDRRRGIDMEALALMELLTRTQQIDGWRLLSWLKSQALWCQEMAECLVAASDDVQRIIDDYGRLAQKEATNLTN